MSETTGSEWKIFKLKCCDPLKLNAKHSGKLRNVTGWMCNYKNVSKGMKICDGCRLKLSHEVKNAEAENEAG